MVRAVRRRERVGVAVEREARGADAVGDAATLAPKKRAVLHIALQILESRAPTSASRPLRSGKCSSVTAAP
jgi:hypothetical protein